MTLTAIVDGVWCHHQETEEKMASLGEMQLEDLVQKTTTVLVELEELV